MMVIKKMTFSVPRVRLLAVIGSWLTFVLALSCYLDFKGLFCIFLSSFVCPEGSCF